MPNTQQDRSQSVIREHQQAQDVASDRSVTSIGTRPRRRRNRQEQLASTSVRSREASSVSDLSTTDVRRSSGNSSSMTVEMRRLQDTVNHLQEFCNTLLQAVTPQVLGNRIVLPSNPLASTAIPTTATDTTATVSERLQSGTSADTLHNKKVHHALMTNIDFHNNLEKHSL